MPPPLLPTPVNAWKCNFLLTHFLLNNYFFNVSFSPRYHSFFFNANVEEEKKFIFVVVLLGLWSFCISINEQCGTNVHTPLHFTGLQTSSIYPTRNRKTLFARPVQVDLQRKHYISDWGACSPVWVHGTDSGVWARCIIINDRHS